MSASIQVILEDDFIGSGTPMAVAKKLPKPGVAPSVTPMKLPKPGVAPSVTLMKLPKPGIAPSVVPKKLPKPGVAPRQCYSPHEVKEMDDNQLCAEFVRLTGHTHLSEANLKSQRKTKNLGFNTAKTQDESYAEIEAQNPTAKCSDGNHEGERTLPVRKFYLNKAGKGLQGACITCQKNRRANRTKRSRDKFGGKNKQEICDMYLKTYGQTKDCSNCKASKPPSEFPTSIGMECGLHNHCITCSIGNSQGNGGLRDFIFMPDKDGIKYKKKDKCERCEGTHRLAVDHILPIAKGGTDCIPNKQTLCGSCNSKKSDTIDCVVTSEFLSTRHKDESLDFTDKIILSRILSKKIYEFRQSHIDNSTLEEIRNSITTYAKKYNLGHNLDRIVEKIATLFGKK